MIVFVDMDGVAADIIPYWLYRYNTDFQDDLSYEDITCWGLEKLVKPLCGEHIRDYLDDPGFFAKARVIDGSIDALRDISDKGHKVYFATHTPETSRTAYYEKCTWADRHFPFIGGDHVIAVKDKSVLLGDVLIDDKPENLVAFQGRRVLYDQPWNRSFLEGASWFTQYAVKRGKDWLEAKKIILSCDNSKC
jgi:5'-nucleotidase